MLLDIIWLVAGLVLILLGANYLTDGASAVAKRFGISDLVIGLTVVALGTSTPELVVSVLAAAQGNAPLAVGNVVGSNIFNILMIVGVTAMVAPIVVKKSVMTSEMPMLLLSALILLMLGNSGTLNGTGMPACIGRTDGLFLLVLFVLFMRYTFAQARRPDIDAATDPSAADGARIAAIPAWRSLLYIVGGLAALVWGGDRMVSGATSIAESMGISDAVIGLTVVAAGTSLPELATSVVAAIKGKPGIAIGNVIGSNILNTVFILGLAGTIHSLPFGSINNVDLGVLVGATLLFIIFAKLFKVRTITRVEGAVLTACYVAYTAWLISNI